MSDKIIGRTPRYAKKSIINDCCHETGAGAADAIIQSKRHTFKLRMVD